MPIMSEPANVISVRGYTFKDKMLLENALTHSSYCNEHDLSYDRNNQRLEFLGDALLDAIIGEELFNRLPSSEEGELSKKRSMIVCEQALEKIAEELRLGEKMFLGKGEEMSGFRKTGSVAADAVEAVIGAVYLDGGWEQARAFVLMHFEDLIKDTLRGKPTAADSKSNLQEILQSRGISDFGYRIFREEGPEHRKTFYVNFVCEGEVLGKGSGRSKKEAEQKAAHDALRTLKEI